MISISNYKEINKGSMVATFDATIVKWEMTIRSMTLFEKDGKSWVYFPSRIYEEDGQKKYYSLVCEKGFRFRDAVKHALSEMDQKTNKVFNETECTLF